MTIGDIVSQARTIVNDTFEPYRYLQSDVILYVRDAVRHLNRVRPETRYVDGRLSDYVLELEEDTEIPVDRRFEESLVLYTVYRVYQEDDSDTVNLQLGQTYLQRSEALMQL